MDASPSTAFPEDGRLLTPDIFRRMAPFDVRHVWLVVDPVLTDASAHHERPKPAMVAVDVACSAREAFAAAAKLAKKAGAARFFFDGFRWMHDAARPLLVAEMQKSAPFGSSAP